MKTSSYWIDTISLQKFPALSRDLDVDVAIIGAGITGITAAYLLKQQGAKVALLDRASWGRVDTGHTTAHLTCVTDTRLPQLVKTFGEDHTRGVWEAGMAAIDQIVTNIRTAGIECDFRWVPGYLHAPWEGAKPSEVRRLRQDAAMARKLGFKADFVPATPFLGLPGVQFFHQAKFHPTKYLNALIRTIPGDGSHVFEKTEMDEVQEKPFAIKAAGHKIRCRYLVLATHTPLMGKTNLVSATLFQTKLYLYSSYAIGAKIPAGLIPEASYWDTSDPYYYLRIDRHRGHDYAIFGGEDHKTGQERRPEDLFKRLEKMLRDRIPAAQVDHRWSGQVIETPDGLPYIGETSRNQFVGTGFSGNGMTFGTLTAMMAVDAFCKRKNPWSQLFDPQRKKIKGGAWAYLKENKDYPYYLVRDWIGGAEGTSVGSLRRGQGKILKIDGQKVAAYRNDQGKVTLCSPVCTHLKCIVRWNPAERTWDCPCHGSRFQPTGEVISGPAEEDLEKLPEREK